MSERPERKGSRGGRRFYSRPRTCQFCSDKNIVIDYKNTNQLSNFIQREGKIRPRRQTGNCAKHQRKLAIAIKRARHMALLPFSGEVLR
ncbi:MAG: 30S ribosomal protein S18 [Anaerolineae bacterium]|nr:30S ribosomal protein S18 [Anaerolineae bacterium]